MAVYVEIIGKRGGELNSKKGKNHAKSDAWHFKSSFLQWNVKLQNAQCYMNDAKSFWRSS